jgi:hypothetical protein
VFRTAKENNRQFTKAHRPFDMSDSEYEFYKEWNDIK